MKLHPYPGPPGRGGRIIGDFFLLPLRNYSDYIDVRRAWTPWIPGGSVQLPAMVMPSTRIEPQRREPRVSSSLPTAAMPLNMSRRLPAMVISSTG